jgi:hypothetical protein
MSKKYPRYKGYGRVNIHNATPDAAFRAFLDEQHPTPKAGPALVLTQQTQGSRGPNPSHIQVSNLGASSSSQFGPSSAGNVPSHAGHTPEPGPLASEFTDVDFAQLHFPPVPYRRPNQLQSKLTRTKNWKRSLNEITISFLEWQQLTRNGAQEINPDPPDPQCCQSGAPRTKTVSLISLEGAFLLINQPFKLVKDKSISCPGASESLVSWCPECSSLPIALVKRGYFPSSPKMPNIGFKIRTLLFAASAFNHFTPNVEGFVRSLADALDAMGFHQVVAVRANSS